MAVFQIMAACIGSAYAGDFALCCSCIRGQQSPVARPAISRRLAWPVACIAPAVFTPLLLCCLPSFLQADDLIAALQQTAHMVAVMEQDVLMQAFGDAQVMRPKCSVDKHLVAEVQGCCMQLSLHFIDTSLQKWTCNVACSPPAVFSHVSACCR